MNENNDNETGDNGQNKRKITEEPAVPVKKAAKLLIKRRRISTTSESSTSTLTSSSSDTECGKTFDNIAGKDDYDMVVENTVNVNADADNTSGKNTGNGSADEASTSNANIAGTNTGSDIADGNNTGNDNTNGDNAAEDSTGNDGTGNDRTGNDDAAEDMNAEADTDKTNIAGCSVDWKMEARDYAEINVEDDSDDEDFDKSNVAKPDFDNDDAPSPSGHHLEVNEPLHAEMTPNNRTPPRPIVLVDDAEDAEPSSLEDDQDCVRELLVKLAMMFEPRILFVLDTDD